MSNPSTKDVDPTDAELREIGKGTLEDDTGPSSAMAHLYRGEIHRMTFWRERLDQTTNWAVIVVAAILTWAFSSPDNPHYILLIGAATLSVFLVIEARRFRGYGIWRSRVRVLQKKTSGRTDLTRLQAWSTPIGESVSVRIIVRRLRRSAQKKLSRTAYAGFTCY